MTNDDYWEAKLLNFESISYTNYLHGELSLPGSYIPL